MTTTLSNATAPTSMSAELQELISAIRAVVRSQSDAAAVGHAVADLLRPCLRSERFLSCDALAPGETDYRQHILHVEPDGSFSIVALVWMPGQATAIHDHVSWCVVGVYQGQEHETIYQLVSTDSEPHLVVTGHNVSPAGTVCALVPPGDIHHVANGGEGKAVSLHIYGADIGVLGSSIRRRYQLPVRSGS